MNGLGTARPLAFVQPCLGNGEYAVEVRRRRTLAGPAVTRGELKFRAGGWSRRLNATSSGDVVVPLSACADLLSTIRPWRDELWIYRDGDLIWRGPILNVTPDEDTGVCTVSGQDVSAWLWQRLFFHTMTPRGIDLARIFEGYFMYALRGIMPAWGKFGDEGVPLYDDDPGLELEVTDTGITGDRTVQASEVKVCGAEMEELARTGMDWTTIASQMWCGTNDIFQPGTPGVPAALPGIMSEEHFAQAPRVRRTGEGMANVVAVRANGFRTISGGPDPDDGVVLARVLDEYSIEDRASAQASGDGYWQRGRVELVHAEGDSNLAASAPVSVATLVPGARVRVDLEGGGAVPYNGVLRLDSVSGQFGINDEGTVEVVRPTLQPLGSNADARGAGG